MKLFDFGQSNLKKKTVMDVTFTNTTESLLDTTESLVCALRAPKPHNSAPLNLKTDFYDPNTGLHSVAQFSHWYRQLGADGERKRGRARHARSAAAVELGGGADRVLPRLWR